MTNSNFERASVLRSQIIGFEKAISSIDKFLKSENENKGFMSNCFFRLRKAISHDDAYETRLVTGIFGGSRYGVEIQLDESFANFLKEGLEKQLAKKRKEFEEL